MSNRQNRPDPASHSLGELPRPFFGDADLPSPRVGEIPPALSPLDAFALQSLLLQKRIEDGNKNGRRMSRLPPLTITNEFKNRPGFLRSTTHASEYAPSDDEDRETPNEHMMPHSAPNSAREVNPDFKHLSMHPSLTLADSSNHPVSATASLRSELTPIHPGSRYAPQPDYFSIPRAHSPDAMEPRIGPVLEATPTTPATRSGYNGVYPVVSRSMNKPMPVRSQSSNSLQPPQSPVAQRSCPRSVPKDSFDTDANSMGGSFDSLPPRQVSTNSSLSRSHSPASPFTRSLPRSPSMSSEYSAAGLPRPSFNFSRPLSSAGRPSFDLSHRQASRDSLGDSIRPSLDVPSRQASGDGSTPGYPSETVHTPISMASEDMSEVDPNAASSYIYSKYSLPRGRVLQRDSIGAASLLNRWTSAPQQSSSNAAASGSTAPPSPPRSSLGSRDGYAGASGASITSSNDTIKAQAKDVPLSEMTPEMHLERGIELHEQGSLLKSTYHLRLAAKANLPTAMLLYALACRHGWGMRPNQAEGVQWLKKAVDSAQIEIADDEDLTKKGKPSDLLNSKTRKAQFALSVYELGVSYMNGWGIQQDRALALRCFEIAGNWGDADALAEAGFCYSEGHGCKKDLKKAAKFYRAAAAKGINMTGNSWIYKDKYNDNDADSRAGRGSKKETTERKPRDKSRTRTIFGRKKSARAE